MGIMKMAEQALSEVETISAEDALVRKDGGELVFVDVRDIREIEKSDTITGSHHAPRGVRWRLRRSAGVAGSRCCHHPLVAARSFRCG